MPEEKGDARKTCFVIMPITTPKHMLADYGNDKEHFQHVLDYLFRPAVEKADYELIPPKTAGAEVIQGDILANLETADLVLCDMSSLNANVFFEFGIRTALNKPVCIVRDERTPRVPFDTSVLNHHEYGSPLHVWELKRDRPRVTQHLRESAESCKDGNPYWRYFALRSQVALNRDQGGPEAKLDLLLSSMDAIRQQMSRFEVAQQVVGQFSAPGHEDVGPSEKARLDKVLMSLGIEPGVKRYTTQQFGMGSYVVWYTGQLAIRAEDGLQRLASSLGLEIQFVKESESS